MRIKLTSEIWGLYYFSLEEFINRILSDENNTSKLDDVFLLQSAFQLSRKLGRFRFSKSKSINLETTEQIALIIALILYEDPSMHINIPHYVHRNEINNIYRRLGNLHSEIQRKVNQYVAKERASN